MHFSIKNTPLIIAVISVLTFIIYLPSIHGDFIHDDRPNLVFNDRVQIDTLTIDSLKNAATSSSAGTLLRPISMGSFALNYYFFGDSPLSFKISNVILHILTGILVFLVIHQIQSILNNNKDVCSTYWFAVVVSVLWLVHPLHVSTVAYVVQRMAILSTFFSLLAMLFYIVGRTKIISNTNSGWLYFTLRIFSILLGIYSKENAVLTPIFILLIEAIIFYPQTSSETYKKLSKFSITIFATLVTILLLIYRNDISTYLSNWYYTTREFNISERLYTQARVIIYYIKWLVLPNIQELGLFHDDIPLSQSLISPITTLLSIITIGVLLLVSLMIRRTMPLLSLGIGWFFIGHILESTIIPLEMIYEHRNYLPSIGLIFAVTSLFSSILSNQSKLKHYTSYIAIIVVAIFSLITSFRTNQWSDSTNFSYFEVQHHPKSLRANHSLGMEYKSMVAAGYLKYKDEAYMYLEKASELGNKRLYSEAALIALAESLNEPAKPEWIDRMIIKLSTPVPRIDDVELLKTITSCTNHACILPTDAAELLFNALESNPKLILNKSTHAKYHSARANFILQHGIDTEEAEYHLKAAINLDPNVIQYYVDYVNLLLALKQPKAALTYVNQAKEKNRILENIQLLTELEKVVNSKINNYSKIQFQ